MKRRPIVAIVGRPNVGKSTFVNRLLGTRESIVDDMPGVTRDRLYFNVEWSGREFTVIDTGGIVPGMQDEIMMSIYSQVEIAAAQADAIVFMTDGRDGLTSTDMDIAEIVRKTGKPVFLAVNKIDTPERDDLINDFYSLGLGDPTAVSAMHGTGGLGDLLDEVIKVIPEYIPDDEPKPIRIAIVGKPNAGKSSLVNSLIGQDRVIVSDVAGTTRDTINTEIEYENKGFVLTDTAGIRRKAKVESGIEKYSVQRAIKAIKESDITVLLLDATEGLTDQDKKITELSIEAGKGLIIAVNKWDIVEKNTYTADKFTKKIRNEAPFLNFAPIIYISAKTKLRIQKIFDSAIEASEFANKKISTSLLNRVILEAFALNPPSSEGGKRLKAYYSTQVNTAPPTFVVFVNNEKLIKASYIRYLENKLREAFGFFGTPIRILMRERKSKEK